MYQLKTTKQFEKDYKLCKKRGLNLDLLNNLFELLELHGTVPTKFKTHKLTGNYAGFLECHIQGDWLLVWAKDEDDQVILLTRTGEKNDSADIF